MGGAECHLLLRELRSVGPHDTDRSRVAVCRHLERHKETGCCADSVLERPTAVLRRGRDSVLVPFGAVRALCDAPHQCSLECRPCRNRHLAPRPLSPPPNPPGRGPHRSVADGALLDGCRELQRPRDLRRVRDMVWRPVRRRTLPATTRPGNLDGAGRGAARPQPADQSARRRHHHGRLGLSRGLAGATREAQPDSGTALESRGGGRARDGLLPRRLRRASTHRRRTASSSQPCLQHVDDTAPQRGSTPPVHRGLRMARHAGPDLGRHCVDLVRRRIDRSGLGVLGGLSTCPTRLGAVDPRHGPRARNRPGSTPSTYGGRDDTGFLWWSGSRWWPPPSNTRPDRKDTAEPRGNGSFRLLH